MSDAAPSLSCTGGAESAIAFAGGKRMHDETAVPSTWAATLTGRAEQEHGHLRA